MNDHPDGKFKETKLDNDALMYQKSKDSVTREDIRKLPLKKKAQYFANYYGVKVLAAVLAIAVLASVLNTSVFNRQICVLSMSFLNDCQVEDTEALSEALEEYIAVESKNDYVAATTFNTGDYQVNMAYVTRLMAGSVDIVLCSAEEFPEQAAKGYFTDLRELLTEEMYDSLSDRILEGQTEETDNEGNVISVSDPLPYGINLSGSSALEEYGVSCPDPVLCVAVNAANTENVVKAVDFFLEEQG